jgi:hypothetical protein
MQMYQINNIISINHGNKIIILIHKVIIQQYAKMKLLRLNAMSKPSPISEGVVEIRINSQPCKGINLTT